MDERLKILLGSEDITSRDNEDLYININLNRSFYEYKKEKYDNDFDLNKQFEKERDSSINFRIYGIIDSNVIDTDGLSLKVYSDSGTTQLVSQTLTTSMNFNDSINVFNKKKGKYLVELNNYSGSSIFIKTPTNNDNTAEQVFEQKLVFYDFDGNFIPYGTETIEVDNNLNTVEINNNFPFFYNKHWIKNNISLQETKYPTISFSGSSSTISEGQTTNIIVYLDKPSPFGNETVDFTFDSGTADTFDFLVYSGITSNSFPGTVQLKFSKGEQYKNITFSASTDNVVEVIENYKFVLKNFTKVKSGNSLSYTVQIKNSTLRTYAIYEISGLYENRLPYSGSPADPNSVTTVRSTPSIFRNGLFYDGTQNEFYPIDEVTVDIKNFSNSTSILPINSGFGNIDDEIWLPGETKTFNIAPKYSTNTINVVNIYLPPSLNNVYKPPAGGSQPNSTIIQTSVRQVIENIQINGFKLEYNTGVYPIVSSVPNGESASYEALKKLLNGGTFDIYNIEGLHKPFTISADDANYTLKLMAKSPGVRLDVKTNVGKSPLDGLIATATTITQFTYPSQSPIQFTLIGNDNNGQTANYQFKFRKKGYKDLNILNAAVANPKGQVNYLVTSLNNVLHNWDAPNNSPIAFSGNPIQLGFFPNNYFLPKSEIFYPGLILLSVIDITNPSASNLTNYGAKASTTSTAPLFIDSGRWYQSPLNTIPTTSNNLSIKNSSQTTLIKIKTPKQSNTTSTPDPNFYSFNYRNGTSGEYTTFYWNNENSASDLVNSGNNLKISGLTLAERKSPGLKYEIDLGTTYGGKVIPPGPLKVTYPGYASYNIQSIKFYSPYRPTSSNNNNISYQSGGISEFILSAKTAGIPFEITDIVNNNPNAEIVVMPILYNEIGGITENPYNNKMGGFSLTPP